MTGGRAGGLFRGMITGLPSLEVLSMEIFLEDIRLLFWLGWVQSSTSSM